MTHREDGRASRSPRASWARRPTVLAALLLGLAAISAVVITITVSSGGGARTSASRPPGGTALPPAATAIRAAKWITGPAGEALKTVNAGLGKLSASERAGKTAAAEIAGTQLAADAKAALGGPMPPLDAALYRSALGDLEKAGAEAASGSPGKASPLLEAGENALTKVTAAENPPVPANPPAAAGGP